ncbi:MAG: xylulose kinase, partial [Anaerolinea sp. 4484_236]
MPSDDEKYILTIDLGTNGPKVALITVKGEMVTHEFEENEVILLPNGGAVQDPDEWWRAISTSAKRLAASNPAEIKHVVAVSCTSQWSGTVAVDQAGNPLMNAIIWMDTRGQPYIRKIAGGAIQVEGYDIRKIIQWLSKTGGAPTHSGKDPIAHILYIQNELPEIYEKTYKFLEPKDYINLKLTGKFAASYDSIALHWVTDNRDIDEVVYDDELFKITTLERRKFPELKRAVDLL